MWLTMMSSHVASAQKADLENDNMEINKKMDLQVASLKTVLESLKLETVRYLAGNGDGPVTSCHALASRL